MAHFNHAYHKAFYLKSGGLKTSGNTTALTTIGDLGLYDADTYVALGAVGPGANTISTLAGGYTGTAGTYALGSQAKFIIANASFQQTDTIGGNPLHGGYSESIKSKDIQFRHINAIGTQIATAGLGQTIAIRFMSAASSKSCFECGTDPMLRIDIKGADALRMLSHNAYRNIDIGGLCNSCNTAGTFLDVKKVVNEFAKNIAADPILSKLIDTTQVDFFSVTANAGSSWQDHAITVANNTATSAYDSVAAETAWDANDGARLLMDLAVVDTQFGVCSFDTRDWNNTEPLLGNVEIIDESGKACDTCRINVEPLTGNNYDNGAPTTNGVINEYYSGSGESVAPVSVLGDGTTALNDILLTQNYLQNPYHQGGKDSGRMREIEGSKAILDNFPTAAQYHMFTLQHTVPRYNNPSGVFDNDQYRYTIYTTGGVNANATTFKTFLDRIQLHAGIEAQYPNDTIPT
tara:strand:+ start:6322 stop:7707 length:1386 start_codon:yes stop_codon:yes gene_type:complete